MYSEGIEGVRLRSWRPSPPSGSIRTSAWTASSEGPGKAKSCSKVMSSQKHGKGLDEHCRHKPQHPLNPTHSERVLKLNEIARPQRQPCRHLSFRYKAAAPFEPISRKPRVPLKYPAGVFIGKPGAISCSGVENSVIQNPTSKPVTIVMGYRG